MLLSCPPRRFSDNPSTVEPIGLDSLSWRSGDHRWSGYQARIPLSDKPIIQSVPRRSSLIDKGYLLIAKVLATWFSKCSTLYGMCNELHKSLLIC